MDDQVDLERIAAVIAKEKPDLVALQEVDKLCKRSGNRDIVAELSKLLDMEYALEGRWIYRAANTESRSSRVYPYSRVFITRFKI